MKIISYFMIINLVYFYQIKRYFYLIIDRINSLKTNIAITQPDKLMTAELEFT